MDTFLWILFIKISHYENIEFDLNNLDFHYN